MKPTALSRMMAVMTIALVAGVTCVAPGQSAGSLTLQDIESSEARTALAAMLRENGNLREKLANAEATVVELQKNLATSNGEAEVLKRKVTQLTMRFEALGLDFVGEGGKGEQRLLKAVNDLRIAEEEKEAFRKALIELIEASIRFQKASATEDSESRAAMELALRNASKALGGTDRETPQPAAVPASLTDGMVIAVKEDLALVVANVGRRHGVQLGMPFRIVRDGKELGVVRVIDVRESISGAVIQDLTSERTRVQVGDQLKVRAER